MAGLHHLLDGRMFKWTPVVGDGQGGLAFCNSWGHKELDTTEWLKWSELIHIHMCCAGLCLVAQLCLSLCDPIDGSSPGSSFQNSPGNNTRVDYHTLLQVDLPNPRVKSKSPTLCVCVLLPSCVRLFLTPWTVICQGPLSTGFCRQEYWSGLSFPSPGDLPYPEFEPRSLEFQTDALSSELLGKPKNTEVGSLSHLQGIFPAQESNQGLS